MFSAVSFNYHFYSFKNFSFISNNWLFIDSIIWIFGLIFFWWSFNIYSVIWFSIISLFSFKNFVFIQKICLIQKLEFHSKILFWFRNLSFIQKSYIHSKNLFSLKTLFSFNNFSVGLQRHYRTDTWSHYSHQQN